MSAGRPAWHGCLDRRSQNTNTATTPIQIAPDSTSPMRMPRGVASKSSGIAAAGPVQSRGSAYSHTPTRSSTSVSVVMRADSATIALLHFTTVRARFVATLHKAPFVRGLHRMRYRRRWHRIGRLSGRADCENDNGQPSHLHAETVVLRFESPVWAPTSENLFRARGIELTRRQSWRRNQYSEAHTSTQQQRITSDDECAAGQKSAASVNESCTGTESST